MSGDFFTRQEWRHIAVEIPQGVEFSGLPSGIYEADDLAGWFGRNRLPHGVEMLKKLEDSFAPGTMWAWPDAAFEPHAEHAVRCTLVHRLGGTWLWLDAYGAPLRKVDP